MVWKRLFGRQEPQRPAPSPDAPSGSGDGRRPAAPQADRPDPGSSRVRVFVSSTFTDMADERDELMSHAWPELRRFCHERQVELVEVDLRWGISEEQATRHEILKLCLDEIRACRPFFIGLLGERYGWVPGEQAFTADLEEEQPWVRQLRGLSVTELEILHGVLNDPEMAGRAFFYFRDPAYAAGRGPAFLAETPEAAARQAALKERIRAVCRARGIPLREGYPDPHALAEMVQADLRAAVDAQYPAESIPDPLERQARDHQAFAESRRRVYIGRPAYDEALDRHALAQGGPLVLVGESGGGKSALLANWLYRWRRAHPRDFIFQHFIGATPGGADHWGLLDRLLADIKRWTGDAEDPPASREDTLRDLPAWLARLRSRAERAGVRAIVVLDALNQLEDRDGALRLGWLPGAPFAGPLRLVVSTLPGEAQEAVERRGWPALRVEPLTAAERRAMAAAYLAQFGKALDAHRLDRLAAAPAAANPLFVKLLLDELRVTGTHERLDERLDGYLAAGSIPALLDQILARYEHAYDCDRPGLVGEALGLLWAARRGLSEPELRAQLRPAGLAQLPPALWAPLRAALEESLLDRGGILSFAHQFLRAAVEQRYASGGRKPRTLRLRLAGYFEAQPVTARACDELPWLLWQAGERERLRACLLDMDRFYEIRLRSQQELLSYWKWLGEAESMGALYAAAFEAWTGGAGPAIPRARASLVANDLAFFLDHAVQRDQALALYGRALHMRLDALGEDHAETALSLANMGLMLAGMGDQAGARSYLERALSIRRRVLGERHPETAASLNSLGYLLQAMGRPSEAWPYLEQALSVYQETLGGRHPETISCLANQGMLSQATGDNKKALPCLERTLELRREVLGEDHPDTVLSLNNLGYLLYHMHRPARARPLFERALEARLEMLGENHPDTAVSANNLGMLLYTTGSLAQARPYLERALRIRREVQGERHPDTAESLNNLGMLLFEMGDRAGARPYLEQALSLRRQVLGERHPFTAESLVNVGLLLKAAGDPAGARRFFEQAVPIFEAALGPGHPDARMARFHLRWVKR